MLANLPFVIRTLVAARHGASCAENDLVAALISIASITGLGVVCQRNRLGLVANGFN